MASPPLLVIDVAGERLALTPEMREEALRLARLAFPPPPPTEGTDTIVDAEGAAAATGVPVSWFLEQARRGAIPHLRFGKYVRFRLAELVAAVERRPSGNVDLE
ncbi:MAG: hypothetical protein NFCOHLIN_01063 [Gammaproteobacteria bacterium]|nr:hypothetical protein [Gammaproteobacteria bacterium]